MSVQGVPRGSTRGHRVGKNKIAVGPREGNTNGVCETIATAANIAIDKKPMVRTNTAHTKRWGKRLSKWMRRERPDWRSSDAFARFICVGIGDPTKSNIGTDF